MQRFVPIVFAAASIFWTGTAAAQEQRIGHTDPSAYRDIEGWHGGSGILSQATLLGGDTFETDFAFIHRGVLQPDQQILLRHQQKAVPTQQGQIARLSISV